MTSSNKLSDPQLLQLLFSALESPIGLLLRTSDWTQLRTDLYACRRQLALPELSRLEFHESWLADGDLIILKSK